MLRVLLADDQAWLRSALRFLLEQESGVEVIGEAGDARALLSRVESARPDLVLLDWELPGMRAAGGEQEILAALHQFCPDLFVIVLSGRPEASSSALDAGADFFVSKADPPESLLAALRAVKQAFDEPAVH
jgi:DNA-binding NarL/FixJ family response regulator